MEFDTILKNGMVIDGSGSPAFAADVGVQDGKITAVGHLCGATAARVLDASGKTVTPGFLDMHRHADAALFRDGFGEAELLQGLTTVCNGNCGLSAAPVFGQYARATASYLAPITGDLGDTPIESLAAYQAALKQRPLPIHAAMLAGAGTIRAAVAGFAKTELDAQDERAIHRLLERTLGEGALGVSLGLGYAPECFYDTAGLLRALAPLKGTHVMLSVHMRAEAMLLMPSIEEMLFVAQTLGVPLQISHLKAIGKQNWDWLAETALKRLERAREDGIDVCCDAYPYTAGSTQLLQIMPPEFLQGGTAAIAARLSEPAMKKALCERFRTGDDFDNYARLIGWENITLSSVHCAEDERYVGRSIADCCAGQEPGMFVADLLARESCAVSMIDFITKESDICRILKHPLCYVISDATYPTEGNPHPRVYGTFVRILERLVKEQQVLTLEEAIHKMTMQPADRYGLQRKGRIALGADADLLVFDPNAVQERCTYDAPRQCCTGIETVLVGGVLAVEHGVRTTACGGTVLEQANA